MVQKIHKAIELAQKYHKGQKRKNGEDYFEAHIKKVYIFLFDYFYTFIRTKGSQWYKTDLRECVFIAAILHDSLEDTDITEQEIEREFGPLVLDMVKTLTHKKGESYYDYIMRIHDSGAISVPCRAIKIADLTCNMEDHSEKEKMGHRYNKYALAKYILSEGKM